MTPHTGHTPRSTDDSLTVSVALCTYNGAAYLREQLESILAQSRPAVEIVLSDDASSDDTVAIAETVVRDWPGAKPELRIIRNTAPLGVVANFEQAASACTGDLIALSDQDDVWAHDKLARFAAIFEADPSIRLAHSDATLVTKEGSTIPYSLLASLEVTKTERRNLANGRSYSALIRRNLVTGATTVFRADLLLEAKPFPPEWIHDEWLAIIAAGSGRTALIDAELVEYRQHGQNQIGARKPHILDKIRKLREPRHARNTLLVARAQILHRQFELLGSAIAPDRRDLARQKLLHEEFRHALPRARIARIPGIAAALIQGRYSRLSRGTMDAMRDLVQPAE